MAHSVIHTAGVVRAGDERGTTADELIELLALRPAWHADALCREPAHSNIDFVPSGRGEATLRMIRDAKAVCRRCIVRAECLAAALADPTTHGIWGGTSAIERRRMREAKVAAA